MISIFIGGAAACGAPSHGGRKLKFHRIPDEADGGRTKFEIGAPPPGVVGGGGDGRRYDDVALDHGDYKIDRSEKNDRKSSQAYDEA